AQPGGTAVFGRRGARRCRNRRLVSCKLVPMPTLPGMGRLLYAAFPVAVFPVVQPKHAADSPAQERALAQ
ncbi:MAG: hypothetical protein RR934_01710, partial [Gordonibacter sp.]|uniref:hypothetical protein n=1 Tax=Gordonibacter sp. TaxID=1968902 RepID=UPI00321FBE13